MHSWPILVFLSCLAFICSMYLMFAKEGQINQSRSLILLVTSYGIISSTFMVLVCSISHFHMVWGEFFHLHLTDSFAEIVVLQVGGLKIDLFSILVVSATVIFYIIAIGFSQLRLVDFDRKLRDRNMVHLSTTLKQQHLFLDDITVYVIDDNEPSAFSYTRLVFQGIKLHIEDHLVISSGLIDLLDPDELETVIAHEYGHCTNEDTRYAHLLVTLTSILRFDPILKLFKRKLDEDQEIAADDFAVEITRKPKSLARALFKLLEFQFNEVHATKHLVSNSKELLFHRIQRLLDMEPTKQVVVKRSPSTSIPNTFISHSTT